MVVVLFDVVWDFGGPLFSVLDVDDDLGLGRELDRTAGLDLRIELVRAVGHGAAEGRVGHELLVWGEMGT